MSTKPEKYDKHYESIDIMLASKETIHNPEALVKIGDKRLIDLFPSKVKPQNILGLLFYPG